MLMILRNNWARLMEEKGYLIVSLILTICAVTAALVLTNKAEVKYQVAVIDEQKVGNEDFPLIGNRYFQITTLTNAPDQSELIFQRYDAVVTWNGHVVKIDTLKGKRYESLLFQALKDPSSFHPPKTQVRKIGTNIIGYMMMFLLIQGILYARLFAEDKEKQQIKRVVFSPIPFRYYLVGHAIFIFLLIVSPSMVILSAAKLLGISIGFSLLQYAALIGVIAFLSTSFALFLNSFFCVADTANMLGSSLIILTSVLAGSFYSFAKSSDWFHIILCILPQKDFMNFADAWEKGNLTNNTLIQFSYIIGISVFFMVFACIKTRRDYVYHE